MFTDNYLISKDDQSTAQRLHHSENPAGLQTAGRRMELTGAASSYGFFRETGEINEEPR